MKLKALLFMPAALAAADLESWHAFDTSWALKPRTELVLRSVVRTRDSFGSVYHARAGAIVEHDLRQWATVLGGYYFQPQRSGQGEWRNGHRPFGGVAVQGELGKAEVQSRTLAERFLFAGAPDSSRYRQRLRVRAGGALRPFASAELLADRRGVLGGRFSSGVRWKLSEAFTLETAYLYEARVARAGAPRQALVTALHFRTASKYEDPDL